MRMKWLVAIVAAAAPVWALAQGLDRGGDEFRLDLDIVNRLNLWQPSPVFEWAPRRFPVGLPVAFEPWPSRTAAPMPIITPVRTVPIGVATAPTSAPEVNGEYAAAGVSLLLGGLMVLRGRRSGVRTTA
jgi:hypothetical protein